MRINGRPINPARSAREPDTLCPLPGLILGQGCVAVRQSASNAHGTKALTDAQTSRLLLCFVVGHPNSGAVQSFAAKSPWGSAGRLSMRTERDASISTTANLRRFVPVNWANTPFQPPGRSQLW